MLRGRMPSAHDFFLANQDCAWVIEFECVNGGATRRTQADGLRTFPAKVNAPRINSRVEQTGLLSCGGINRGSLRAFPQRTGNASDGEISRRRFPAGIERSDMVNVKTPPLAGLCEAAILAAVARTLNHLSPQWGRNEHCLRRRASSVVQPATGAMRESRPVRPALRLRAVRLPSTLVPHPVCRAGSGAVDPRLWAGGIASNHRASQLELESLVAYKSLGSEARLHESISGVQAEFAPSFSLT